MLQSRPIRRRVAGVAAVALTAAVVPVIGTLSAASAASTELFISEYVEGSSNNKALEIYNGTGAAIDLAANGYAVRMYFNGSTTPGLTVALTGTVASGDVHVLAQSSAVTAILDRADQTNSSSWFNGDDAVVLVKGETVVDSVGQIGLDPGSEWGSGLASTADNTLRRKGSVLAGDADASDAFDPAAGWDGYATDTFDGLGAHTVSGGPAEDAAPAVASTSPTSGATGVPVAANVSVTFTEDVDVSGSWFALVCATSGTKAATVTGGPRTFTLDPETDFAQGEACTLTVSAAQVADRDDVDPPDGMTADHSSTFTTFVNQCELPYTEISAIQGSGATVALTGTRTTEGVVVGDYEGASPNLRGFFIQDLEGDGNPATSDGIFVFEGSNADAVSLGDVVRVTGTAGESNGQSQISIGSLQKCGTATVAPTDVTFPVASATDLERFEGMLVRLPQTMHVTEHFQLGRFGQVVLSADGRLQQPTNVVAPGAPALARQAENALNRIIVDDASQAQNPDPVVFGRGGEPLSAANTLRGGDTATGIVGVLNYTWGGNNASPNAYRVRPIGALGGNVSFTAANPRPATPPVVGGTLRVAGMNLLNYFNTFSGCTSGVGGGVTDCRGAGSQAEFDRQWPKTVAAVGGTGADVVGIVEIENDGYGATSAIATLVDQLNAASAPGTWAYVDVDAATGEVNALGTDAIKVGAIYKPAKVTPVGTTAALNTRSFVTGGDGAERNRPALAQAFREKATGGVFTAVVNHLKSKGSACEAPDAGDGQGNCNAVRVNAATELATWLESDPTGTGDPDRLILGDLNSYAMEDPITALKGAGYTNLIADRIGPDAYSYVFDGQWGYLDHALGSASIGSQVSGVADWHINADEPSVLDYNTDFKSANLQSTLYEPDQFRVSDHDPVIVGLDLTNAAPVVGTITVPSAPVLAGTSVSVSAPFSDADALGPYTATIAWGDGSSSSGTVDAGKITGSHVYGSAGLHTVTVTVTDAQGASGARTSDRVVVYDPAAGFVTGGGWVASPAGDLPAGKGSFDLSVKYVSGAATPAGSLTFSLDTAPFSVASSTVDWLVVAGRTASFAGTATVNGEAGHRFEVTTVDNGSKGDTFRLVVTDSEGAVYDSGVQQVRGQVSVLR